MPPHTPLLAAPLVALTEGVLRHPRWVLWTSLLLAGLATALATGSMGFHTSRLDLLNPQSDYNQLWIEYLEEFGGEDDTVVVVEGGSEGGVTAALEDLAAEIAREPDRFQAVLHQRDLSAIRAKGLHYLPTKELAGLEGFVWQLDPVIHGGWGALDAAQLAAGVNRQLEAPPSAEGEAIRAAAADDAARFTASLSAALLEARYESPWPSMPASLSMLSQADSEYLITPSRAEGEPRWLGFVLLRIAPDEGQFDQGTEAIDRLRGLIAAARARHPRARIGLTGLPVMENDEMRASQADTLRASLLSLAGVAVLFIAGFGGVRHPLLTVLTLLLALAWSFGYLTLAIGHLNILSVSFSVILIGLGIDFGIHYVAGYQQWRREGVEVEEALRRTARGIGPGIVCGGLTTSVAFFCSAFTEFTGVAELGAIAGGGILLCLAGALVTLPALLRLIDSNPRVAPPPPPLATSDWLRPLLRFPRLLMTLSLAAILLLACGLPGLRYDHNLLNMQPDNLESVAWEHKLLEETDESMWYALSIADSREELLARKQAFLDLPTVSRVDEIVSLLPGADRGKQERIAQVAHRLQRLPERPPLIPVASPDRLAEELARMRGLMLGSGPRDRAVRRQLDQLRETLRQVSTPQLRQVLGEYQQRVAGELLGRLHLLRQMADPAPPQLTDLPEGLVTRFVGKSDRHLLRIYGKGHIWDMEHLEAFVRDVKGVDPRATGNPLQTYYASRQMKQSYLNAAWYALAAVLVILYLDFRNLLDSLLAALPLTGALLALFGLMGWLDIPLNPANMIVLPLILGIGIDDGVHVVHDYRRQRGPYRLGNATATAILLTSLTTMVGFGSMMIAGHQGLRSLGRVLTLGVGCCLFTSLVLLPSLLAITSRLRREEALPADEQAADRAAEAIPLEEEREPPPKAETPPCEPAPPETVTLQPQRRLIRPRRVA